MWRYHAIGPSEMVTRVADAIARWSPTNGLSKALASYSDADLDLALGRAGRCREDLFRNFRGNARHRQLLAHMIQHFGVDLDYADRYYWDRLKQADRVCIECPNTRRCRSWIAWGRRNDAARVFCPNAELFDEVAHAAAKRRGGARSSH